MAKGTRWDMLVSLKTKGEAGLKRMGNSMQGLQGRLKNVRMAALSVNTAFKAMATILVAGSITRFLKSGIDQADAFGKLSRQTGVAADTLQSYVNAGKLAGVEQVAIDKGLSRLAQSMREADQGINTYTDSFDALGIKVRDSEGNLKSTEQVFKEIADRFRDMPDGATKAALAMELFSRQGRKLIPLLNAGSEELDKWNYQTSEGFAANAEFFNDNLTMLGFAFDGFKKQLSDAVLPALNSIAEAFLEIFNTKNDWEGFFNFIEGGLRGLSFLLMSTVVLMEEMIHLGGAIGQRFSKFFKGDFKGMDESAEKYKGGFMERFKRNQETFGKIVSGTSEAGDEYGFNKGTKDAALLEAQLTKTFGGAMKAKLNSFAKSVGDFGGQIGDVLVKTFKGLEDQLVSFVTTGKVEFKKLAQSIIADMSRIAIRAMIVKPLMAAFGITGSAKGNVFNQQGVVPYAKGGLITSPTLSLMGERGPESVMPLQRGKDGKLGVIAHGSGSSTTVNVSVDAKGTQVTGSKNQGAALGRAIAGAVKEQLIKERRPGGVLYA
tara:strand:- start:908 stop:2551 length:1644 start_codon:yes stop_codon:yes gene_type:complete